MLWVLIRTAILISTYNKCFYEEKTKLSLNYHQMSLVMRKPAFCICENKEADHSFAVTAKLISAFLFATRTVQSLYLPIPKFQASSYLLWLYSPACVDLVRNPEDRFSHNEAQLSSNNKYTPCLFFCFYT